MPTQVDLQLEERLFHLFQHLGIEQAHIVTGGDWQGFAGRTARLWTFCGHL